MFDSVPFWMMILGFLLVLGPLITIHELGHYLVGRWFGVGAEAFSIGFGKELIGWTDKRGTRWKISALPLGGYVQFKGDMNPASIPDANALNNLSDEEKQGNFQHAKLWKRALIVFAGPATNLIVAIAIFAAFNMAYGKPVPVDSYIERFAAESAARDSGIKVGDRIVAVNGKEIGNYREVGRAIGLYPNQEISVTVERDGQILTLPVTTKGVEVEDQFGNKAIVGRIGVEMRWVAPRFEKMGPVDALTDGVQQCLDITRMMITGIVQIVAGDRSVKELGGPLKIAKYSGEQLSLGTNAFVWFIAIISLNLAFINLLPIPALDGGHLAFYAVEAIRRKPISPRGTEWAYRIGVVMVLVMMVFVTVNDVVSLPIFGG